MSALAKTDYAPWSLSEAVVSDFIRKGVHVFEERLGSRSCAELLDEIRAGRRFDETLFLSPAELDAPAPPAARDALERLDAKLQFVERAPHLVEALWSLLGPDYRMIERRVLCQLPAAAVPEFVKRRLQADPGGSLRRFVRPERRDISFAVGGEFGQDLAMHGGADVVTLEVCLQPVGETDAPTCLLEGSHRMGASARPHDLKRTGADSWRYRNGRAGEMYVTERLLTGEAGSASLWHACALHGVLAPADQPRISLRYRFVRGEARHAGLDAVNASLAGPTTLEG